MNWQEPTPGEREAGERSWSVVREAFRERVPAQQRRDWRPLVALAAGVAVLAAAFTPPGHAVLGSIRDAVQGEENAKPALFSLPTAKSRLLVNSAGGAWIVQSDGSKRLLAGYRDASWSPNGLYLAAVHGEELRAIEPDGDVRWSIGRSAISHPRWSSAGGGDERVAYFSGNALRVIGGDGRGDRLLGRADARVAPSWLPGTHLLAYADAAGRVVVRDADTGRVVRMQRAQQRPLQLEWSRSGRRLLVRGPSSITVFGPRGQRLEPLGAPGTAPVVAATFSPDGRAVAFLQTAGGRSHLWVYPRLRPDGTAGRQVFSGAGRFAGVDWSPDRRWLLLDWKSADQLLFIRSAAARRVVAVSNVEANFGQGASLGGWCCQ